VPILLPRVRKFTSTWWAPERAQKRASAIEACTITGHAKRRRFLHAKPYDLRLRPTAAPAGSAGVHGGPGFSMGVRATTCRASSLPRVSIARLCVPVGEWPQRVE